MRIFYHVVMSSVLKLLYLLTQAFVVVVVVVVTIFRFLPVLWVWL